MKINREIYRRIVHPGSKLNYLVLPADYWQEEETENYFIEEETSIILTLEDI
jgi:hypothetical protein